jgi:hypothetical protein
MKFINMNLTRTLAAFLITVFCFQNIIADNTPFFVINENNVKIRYEPFTPSEKTITLKKGEKIEILDFKPKLERFQNKWGIFYNAKVKYDKEYYNVEIFSYYLNYNFQKNINNNIYETYLHDSNYKNIEMISYLFASIQNGEFMQYDVSIILKEAKSFTSNHKILLFEHGVKYYGAISSLYIPRENRFINQDGYDKILNIEGEKYNFTYNEKYGKKIFGIDKNNIKNSKLNFIPLKDKKLKARIEHILISKNENYVKGHFDEFHHYQIDDTNGTKYIVSSYDRYKKGTYNKKEDYLKHSSFTIFKMEKNLQILYEKSNSYQYESSHNYYFLGVTDLDENNNPEMWIGYSGYEFFYFICLTIHNNKMMPIYVSQPSHL